MTPEEIKNASVSCLQEAVIKMMGPEWDLALGGKPKEVQDQSGKILNEAQKQRLRLENAQLAKIAKKLKKNEKELKDGKKNLEKALSRLEDVQNVLDMATAFLGTVTRVLAVAGRTAGGGA